MTEEISQFEGVPVALQGALAGRGFSDLTPVQRAVLAPSLAGRDVRLASQTGSGKTVAVGFLVAHLLATGARQDGPKGAARPKVVVVAPTRELATQVQGELAWLFAPLRARVVAVIGGTSVAGERRELSAGVDVVVGTPGRLLDHLERGAVDASNVGAVILDEADQMFDLGFRDELEAILTKMPVERATHLVSATFPREVLALADRYQREPAMVEGTRLGVANADIAHVAHVVRPAEREAALVNLLLVAPDDRTLAFVRTRADASELADRLASAGFGAAALTGEMDQRARSRTLDAFRSGAVHILVATDVAARGLDIPDVTRVIHVDPPDNTDTYTHRSGRTGRAGRKGTSVLLVPPPARETATRMFRRLRVEPRWSPVPGAPEIERASVESLRARLDQPAEGEPAPAVSALARGLVTAHDPLAVVARLASMLLARGPCAPRVVTALPLPGAERANAARGYVGGPRERVAEPYGHAPRARAGGEAGYREAPWAGRGTRAAAAGTEPPSRAARRVVGRDEPHVQARGEGGAETGAGDRAARPEFDAPRPRPAREADDNFVTFRINWGARQGADPRRLLALVCRRGEVRGDEVGAIHVGPTASIFDVAASVARDFAEAAARPDPREPHVRIARAGSGDDPPGRAYERLPRPHREGPPRDVPATYVRRPPSRLNQPFPRAAAKKKAPRGES